MFSALLAIPLCFATTCKKQEIKPGDLTPQQLDSINAHLIDYTLQVIPDIHEIIPKDFLNAMDSIPKIVHNASGGYDTTYISALYFGDNPPTRIAKDSLGFFKKDAKVSNFIKSNPLSEYNVIVGETKKHTNYFLFSDQHRGVAKYDYKCVHLDTVYGGVSHQYVIEYSSIPDYVYIMGEDPKFTAYFVQDRHKESNLSTIVDYGSHEYVVLSGEVTDTGIKNLYYGIKIKGYDNPADAGQRCLNIDDILIFYFDELPYRYWDPDQHYNQ